MSYIDNTWVAYAFDEPASADALDAALERVRSHYSQLYAEPLTGGSRTSPTVGMALWRREDPRLRWPCWAEEGGIAVASTNAATGWERVVGVVDPARAPLELGRALAKDPERLVELNPPFVLAILDSDAGRLVIVNDFLATARFYELRTPSGWVWSNRLGALPLFAGIPPELDPDGWAIHAAAGWFLGTTTPLGGGVKVGPGTAINVVSGPSRATVTHTETGAVRQLVAPRRASLAEQASAAPSGRRRSSHATAASAITSATGIQRYAVAPSAPGVEKPSTARMKPMLYQDIDSRTESAPITKSRA